MRYVVLPNFLRRREQRYRGLLTPVQLFAAMVAVMGVLSLANASLWALLPGVPAGLVLVAGLSPAEGGFLYQKWLAPLRVALFPHRAGQVRAFADLGEPPAVTAPLIWQPRGSVALAGEAAAAPAARGRRP
jgi:hypothetical protein